MLTSVGIFFRLVPMNPTTFNHEFLHQLRLKKEWTLELAAKQLYQFGLDISDTTLRNWELGESEPDASNLAMLARLYGVKNLRDFYRDGEAD